jgi:hypothetical protein
MGLIFSLGNADPDAVGLGIDLGESRRSLWRRVLFYVKFGTLERRSLIVGEPPGMPTQNAATRRTLSEAGD